MPNLFECAFSDNFEVTYYSNNVLDFFCKEESTSDLTAYLTLDLTSDLASDFTSDLTSDLASDWTL